MINGNRKYYPIYTRIAKGVTSVKSQGTKFALNAVIKI